MTDPIEAQFQFDIKFMRKGKRSVGLLLPLDYHAPIGLVIAYWGNFEIAFDTCLKWLITEEQADGSIRDVAGWQRRQFESRRKLFKEICNEWLSTWRPKEAVDLIQIVDKSADLSAKRNNIAHGTFQYTILPYSSTVTNILALNHSNGKPWPFDVMKLKKLYHDISHLTAELFECFSEFAQMQGQPILFEDKELLRVYRETIHPWNPNPKKRQSPPKSSQA